MKLTVFSAKPYDKKYLSAAAPLYVELTYHDVVLTPKTAALLSDGEADALYAFLPAEVLESLYAKGVRAILMRCMGFNNIDLDRAEQLGLFVAYVPAYSPEAVAEFAVALIQTINRKTYRAYIRVREGNFALDGLLGRTLYGKTVGLIGTGHIGMAFARIMRGYGCRLLAYNPYPSKAFEEYGEYTSLEDLIPQSDIISLYCPLTYQTRYIISERTLALLKPGTIMVNTSRGGLVDTRAVIQALKTYKLAGLALDVYEGEGALFYDDYSGDIIDDDKLIRLMTFPNVVVYGY